MTLWPNSPRWLKRVVVVLAVLVGLHITASAASAWYLHRVSNELAESGRPITAKQVIPVVVDADNAANDYRRAFVLATIDGTYLYNDHEGCTLSPAYEHLALALTLPGAPAGLTAAPVPPALKPNPHYIWVGDPDEPWRTLTSPDFLKIRSFLRSAVAKPACAFPMEWSQGLNMTMPMTLPMLQLTNVLCYRALLCQRHGDDVGMREDLSTALAMAVQFRKCPFFICSLVSFDMENSVLETLSTALARGPVGALSNIQPLLAQVNDNQLVAKALDVERIMLGDVGFQTGQMPYGTGVFMTPQRLFDQASYDLTMGRMASNFEKGLPTHEIRVPRLAVITRMLQPAVHMMDRDLARAARHRAVAQLALALETMKRERGIYPRQLSDLDPAPSSALLALAGPLRFTATDSSWALDLLKLDFIATKPSPLDHWHSPP